MGRDPHIQKPQPFAAAAARVRASVGPDSTIASEFNVTKDDMAIGYMSQDPFFDSFEEEAWAAFELRASDSMRCTPNASVIPPKASVICR